MEPKLQIETVDTKQTIMPEQSLSIVIEEDSYELSDGVRIKTTERRCTKGWRITIESLAFVLGIISLSFATIQPILDINISETKITQYIICVIINVFISFCRIAYNLIACETDTEGIRKCCIILNAIIGFVMFFWQLSILINAYIIAESLTSIFIFSTISTYFIINCWNVWRLRYATP